MCVYRLTDRFGSGAEIDTIAEYETYDAALDALARPGVLVCTSINRGRQVMIELGA
jgi:hypothetical protein